jgi:hypothetical protein
MIIKPKRNQNHDFLPKEEIPKSTPFSGWEDFDTHSIEAFVNNKSYQFFTSKGSIFARLNVEIDKPFALNYHYKKTAYFSEFIESINKYLGDDLKLDDSDTNKLKNMYENYGKILSGATPHSQELVDFLLKKGKYATENT